MEKEKQGVKDNASEIEVNGAESVLATIKVAQLIDVSSWEEKQKKLVKENPFIEIVDNKTYEEGKKRRTALVKGRTELQNQKKPIKALLSSVSKEVDSETDRLIEITVPFEEKQQAEVKRYEDAKAEEKERLANAEKDRVKKINDRIETFETDSYQIIQNIKFPEIEDTRKKLSEMAEEEFDYEEFDILFDMAKDRIATVWEDKVKTLTDNENQRLKNIELEKENAVAKAKAELQASRLNEIMPYVAFGEALDLTKLSELEQDTYSEILSSKKALYDADVEEKEKTRLVQEKKEKEEKDAIWESRKNRLVEIGFNFAAFQGFNHPEFETVKVNSNKVYEASTLEFENILVEAKSVILEANAKVLKDKISSRTNKLLELGFEQIEGEEYTLVLSPEIRVNESILATRPQEWFDEFVIDSMKYLEAQVEIQKQKDIEAAEADAEKLKSENKARIAKYAPDKKLLTKFVKSLEFRGPVPELENEDLQVVLDEIFQELDNTRGALLTKINLF